MHRYLFLRAVIVATLSLLAAHAQENKQSQAFLGTTTFITSRRFCNLGEDAKLVTIKAVGERVDPKTRQRADGPTLDSADSADTPADNLRLVQVPGGLDAATARALSTSGMRIIGYLPHNTYIVVAPAAKMRAVKALPAVRWAGD